MPSSIELDPSLSNALAIHILALGDDELVLGHRDSEWCGHAPILEEDIAFANLALDEMGHAMQWYGLHEQLVKGDRDDYADRLVFLRPWQEWRNIQMVELPRGDFAFSMLRQFLFDSAEAIRLESLGRSTYPPLAAIAEKMLKEELYHIRHSRLWVQRLGLGTQESQARTQSALQVLWTYALQMWVPIPGEELLVSAGVLQEALSLRATWLDQTATFLRTCGLVVPSDPPVPISRWEHTAHLQILLSEMQSVYKLDPQAQW